jgi:hypothetical protein
LAFRTSLLLQNFNASSALKSKFGIIVLGTQFASLVLPKPTIKKEKIMKKVIALGLCLSTYFTAGLALGQVVECKTQVSFDTKDFTNKKGFSKTLYVNMNECEDLGGGTCARTLYLDKETTQKASGDPRRLLERTTASGEFEDEFIGLHISIQAHKKLKKGLIQISLEPVWKNSNEAPGSTAVLEFDGTNLPKERMTVATTAYVAGAHRNYLVSFSCK